MAVSPIWILLVYAISFSKTCQLRVLPGSVPDGVSGFGSRRSVPFLKEVPNRGIGMRPEVRMAVRIDPFPAPSFKSADQEAARQNQDQFG